MEDLLEAFGIIDAHPNLADFEGPKSADLIAMAEAALGLSLPPTFRRFLLTLGAGNFGYAEFYGVLHSDFTNSSVPDCVWLTVRERHEYGLPGALDHVYDVGDGSSYFLDTAQRGSDGESPVVEIALGMPAGGQGHKIVASDFGELLLSIVREVVSSEVR
jgi:hypothetical protein